MKCPECGNEECWRDEVDVGVGTQYGPWNCDKCGWTQRDEVDGLIKAIFMLDKNGDRY